MNITSESVFYIFSCTSPLLSWSLEGLSLYTVPMFLLGLVLWSASILQQRLLGVLPPKMYKVQYLVLTHNKLLEDVQDASHEHPNNVQSPVISRLKNSLRWDYDPLLALRLRSDFGKHTRSDHFFESFNKLVTLWAPAPSPSSTNKEISGTI